MQLGRQGDRITGVRRWSNDLIDGVVKHCRLRRVISGLVITVLAIAVHADRWNPQEDPWLNQDPSEGPLDARHLALVVNENDPVSVAVGNYYQRIRSIPDDQVIRVQLPQTKTSIDPGLFQKIKRDVDRKTPSHVQVYALAWTTPFQVGCQSITTAFAFGYDPLHCASGCRTTKISPYHARGDVKRPWNQLGIRPSMMLAAESLDKAKELIDRGYNSDDSAPPGTGYLVSTSDSARNVRANQYAFIQRTAPRNFKIKIIKGDALIGANDVMGYFTGLAFVPGIQTNRYRPGAVADHLTSYGGRLTNSTQMSSLRWLTAGATASYGTVVEPCSFIAKFPNPGLFFTYYVRGDTLIESYWRSVVMPGQGVFIGEPLARPWPVRP